MLVLAVHNLRDAASAKIPFSMVILLDSVSKKLHPQNLRCRQILPTSGKKSMSLWEAPSKEALSAWLNELLEADCDSEVFEIQEQFAIGINEVVATRVGEQLTATTRSTAAAATQKLDQFDEKYKISQQAGAALKVAKESGQVAASKVSDVYTKLSSRAMENEKVAVAASATAQAASSTATAFKGLGEKITTSLGQAGLGKWMMPGQGAAGASAASGDSSSARQSSSSGQADSTAPLKSSTHGAEGAGTRAGPPSYTEAISPKGETQEAPSPVKAAKKPSLAAVAESPLQQSSESAKGSAAVAPRQDHVFSLGEDGEEDVGPVLVESTSPAKGKVGAATKP